MKNTKDLTCGNIRRELAALAVPLVLGNILQQLYNTVDSFIVGRYVGNMAFAAIGIAGSIMNFFIFILYGGCSGISIVFAELYGQKNWKKLKTESFLSLLLGMGTALVLSAVGILSLPHLLRLMQTPGKVFPFAYAYLRIIFLGMPAAFLYNWCSAVLRAAGDTRTPLWVLLVAMVLNTVLDYVLVVFGKMGTSGTALSTAASQLFSAVICLRYMKNKYPELLFGKKDMVRDRHLMEKTAKLGIVSALHQSSLYIGKMLVQGAVNTGGIDIISAYTATMRIEGFANSFSDSGSAAISVFVAQNRGAGNRRRAKEGFRKGLQMMAVFALALSVLMAVFTGKAVTLLMGSPSAAVLKNAQAYMNVIAVFYVLCFVGNSFVGFYRGLGMMQIPVAGTVLHISIRVALSYLLIGRLGLCAVAVATGAGWVMVVIFHYLVYRRISF